METARCAGITLVMSSPDTACRVTVSEWVVGFSRCAVAFIPVATGTSTLEVRSDAVGALTVRDVTLPVQLSGRFLGGVVDPSGKTRVAFHATAAISRKDFGLMQELEKESGGILLGKDILIEISAEATLASA